MTLTAEMLDRAMREWRDRGGEVLRCTVVCMRCRCIGSAVVGCQDLTCPKCGNVGKIDGMAFRA